MIVVIASMLAACATSEDGEDLLGGDPVGTWRERPNATDPAPDPVEELFIYEIAAGGMLTARNGANDDMPDTGTWVAEGGVLSFKSPTSTIRIPYRASSDHLVILARVPVGEVDGPFGVWTSTALLPIDLSGRTGTVTTTIDLRADGTLTYDERVSGKSETSNEGTWTRAGDDFRLRVELGNVGLTTSASLVEGVLGTVHERI